MGLPDGIEPQNENVHIISTARTKEIITMRENPIDIAVCAQCNADLFVEEQVHLIKHDVNSGQYVNVANTMLWKCVQCNTFIQDSRTSSGGQANIVRRELTARLNEGAITKPNSTRIDLNTITGTRKPLLRRQGGLSGAGIGLPSSDS